MLQHITFNLAGFVQRKMLHGRPHYVVPASILPDDGVLVGNNGPVFYPREENIRYVLSWNNKPILAYHPDDGPVGENAAALDVRSCGVLLNTRHFKSKLRTDCWFDIERTKSVDARIIDNIEKQIPIECSTGLEVDIENREGEVGGVKYAQVARNYRPDHLAVFVDMVGAYSIADGGGVMQMNAAGTDAGGRILVASARQALSGLRPMFQSNELSFDRITCELSEQLAAKFGQPGKSWGGYLEAVYDKYVVFTGPDYKRMMQKYTVSDDAVSLKGNPVAVERVVEYRTPDGTAYSANAAGGLSTITKREKKPMDRVAHIATLIANGGWQETDREALEAMPDAVLEKIKPVVLAPVVTTNQVVGGAVNPPTPSDADVEKHINSLPPSMQDMVREGIRTANAARAQMVKEILEYPRNQFTEEQLRSTPMPNLRAIHNMVPPKVAAVTQGVQALNAGGFAPLVGAGSLPINNYAGAAGAPPIVPAPANGPPLEQGGLQLPRMDYGKAGGRR